MNTSDTICKRKSIRSYTGELISEEELSVILKAANAAPVGMGRYEDVHLTVIKNKELLEKINNAGAEMFGKPGADVLYGAPMLLLISARLPEAEGMRNVSYSNAAIIAQNAALAATELGVGVCHIWGATMAITSHPDILKDLTLPEGFSPCCALTLGKTDEKYTAREIPENRIETNVID